MNFDYYARLSNEAAMAQNALSTAPHKSQAVVKTSSPKERGYSTIYLFDRPAVRSKRTYVQALVADEFSDFQKNIIRDAFYGLGKVVGHEAYQNLIDDIRAGRSFTHPSGIGTK